MVEGPGCTLNGEKVRSQVSKGQKVKEVRGSLTTATVSYVVSQFVDYQASVSFNSGVLLLLSANQANYLSLQKNNTEGHSFHSFNGCQYTGVESLGKELFMYFGPRALR